MLSKNDTWMIDSSYFHHMTNDKTKFEQLEHYHGGNVKFGNNETCYVKGKGCTAFIDELKCDNPYQVEGLRQNILSLAQLNTISYKVEFMNGKAKKLCGKGNLVGTRNQTKSIFLHRLH